MTASPPPSQEKDNLFGICAALGEDFGFNPILLRVPLALLLLWWAEAVVIAYTIAGVIVLASRLLFPNGQRESAPMPVAALETPAHVEPPVELAKAA